MVGYWQVLLAGLFILLLVGYALFKIWPKSGRMGINTKTVNCHRCGLKAPMARRPANPRQVLRGGYQATVKCLMH